ncbi:class I SAM-dependent methyltransferase [Oryzifoliimicrobium ureilyticus]|uniref:class I SAM-dependent methyltransferase n=1 Tax=Oryzifoliimicrobium ureilyticus TaxID=3113724 RepID=UPI00307653BF
MARPQFSPDGYSLIMPQSVNEELFSSDQDNDDHLPTAEAEFVIVINIAMQRLETGKDKPEVVEWLISQLHQIRHKFGPLVWRKLIPIIQAHSSAQILQQCPFTRWSFEKPRGYSGDASLIDFIYGHPAVAAQVASSTQLGLSIFEHTINAPGPVAVRERRDILTTYVDKVAEMKGTETEVLAIAAGHLREAEKSQALAEGRLKRWVALDQDPQSLGSITSQFRDTSVEAIDGSVRGLLAHRYELGTFDLVYAAGLYDYLSDKVAVRLTEICLDMLKPGGVFLFANFSDEMVDDGYMESYMNWELLQRSEADMLRLADSASAGQKVETTVWFGSNRNILYCTIKKLG